LRATNCYLLIAFCQNQKPQEELQKEAAVQAADEGVVHLVAEEEDSNVAEQGVVAEVQEVDLTEDEVVGEAAAVVVEALEAVSQAGEEAEVEASEVEVVDSEAEAEASEVGAEVSEGHDLYSFCCIIGVVPFYLSQTLLLNCSRCIPLAEEAPTHATAP